MTIQLVRQLGLAAVSERARALGIESALPPDLSMALGSGAVTPVELLRAYATFAAGGQRPEASLVREVWDATGAISYKYVPPVTSATAYRFSPFALAPVPQALDVPFGLMAAPLVSAPVLDSFPAAISPETAFQMTYLLRNVVERGTGWRARALGRPAAGKTGTTDENVDSWFAGYTPQLATVVWVGFDQLRELGKFETGARAALPIWTNFMIAAHRGVPTTDFEVPPGILWRSMDAQKGTPATPLSQKTLLVPFREGTEPGAVDAEGVAVGGQGGVHELFDEDYLHRTSEW